MLSASEELPAHEAGRIPRRSASHLLHDLLGDLRRLGIDLGGRRQPDEEHQQRGHGNFPNESHTQLLSMGGVTDLDK